LKNQRQRDRELEAFIEGFLSTGKGQSSYSDLMRFVQISDFIPVNNLSVYNVQSLEVIENDGWTWYSRNARVVQSYLETIATGEYVEGDIKVTYNEKLYNSLRLKGKGAILDINEIKRLVYGFSYNIIEHEIDFSKFYGIDFLQKFYESLKKINTESSPVIKLGQGSGFLATTIGLEIKKYPDVYEEVRKSTRGRSYPFEFPKTRKIVVEEKMPLGWCKFV
jgi:CRISPR-associated protein Csm5